VVHCCLSSIVHCSSFIVRGVLYVLSSAPTYLPCKQWLTVAGVGGWCEVVPVVPVVALALDLSLSLSLVPGLFVSNKME
jgi:hypothetical protein